MKSSDIKSKILEIGIPKGATRSQIKEINKAVKYGADNGVKVNVRTVQ